MKRSSAKANYIKLFPLLLLLAACTAGDDTNRRRIMVSIEPLRYFATQIAGDRFEVSTMVPTRSNPEIYEPSAQQIAGLTRCDLYIQVGKIGFERAWMKRIEQAAPHTIVVDSSEGIEPCRTAAGHYDPHTWMSTANAIAIAHNIYRALAAIDTKDSLYFKSNLENLVSRIRQLDTRIREQLTRDKSTTFLIYHPSLTYYARDYGLTQLPIEEEGREPSAAELGQTIAAARQQGVRSLFLQRQFDNRNTQTVARETGAKVIPIDPLSYKWEEEMLLIAKRLQ